MPIAVNREALDRLVVQAVWRFSPPVTLPTEEEVRQFHRGIHVLDRGLFQVPGKGPDSGMPITFSRDVRVPGVAVINHKPLILNGDQLELGLIYHLPGAKDWTGDHKDHSEPSGFNELAKSVYRVFNDVFEQAHVHRFGKIYNYTFGPYSESAHEWLRTAFLNLPDMGDYYSGQVRFVLRREDRNFIHEIASEQRPDGKYQVNVKLDVNNCEITKGVHHFDIDNILSAASKYHSKELMELLAK